MRFVFYPPVVLFGCEAEFRFVPDTPRKPRLRDTWQLWLNGRRQAGPAAISAPLRVAFPTAGFHDLEARTPAGEVLYKLHYRVCATLTDELEAVAFWDSPATQLSWVKTIRGRGVPPLEQLEQAIKDQFLSDPANDDRWARGVRLLVCLYHPELLRSRPAGTSADDWEDALERVVVTFLDSRVYKPELEFRPFCAKVLFNQCVNGHRKNGFPDPDRDGGRKPFADLNEEMVAGPQRHEGTDPPECDDRWPLEIRVPFKLRHRVRLSLVELNFAARRNLEFAWEPRRRKPWTLAELKERAVLERHDLDTRVDTTTSAHPGVGGRRPVPRQRVARPLPRGRRRGLGKGTTRAPGRTAPQRPRRQGNPGPDQ